MESPSSSSLPTTISGTSELFICFTSRLSSSMKITSKSILSPGRAAGGRDSSQISLSSSLNRRLKTSGSLKGGQASPVMFPTAATGNNKKRSSCSSGFENPEPSSPKVTCIGQVRVKTKKQGKKMRYRSSKRRSNNNNNNGGQVSFRRAEKGGGGEERETKTFEQVQKMEENKWVTICEALRGFGAEFNCFLPCRFSCMTTKQTNNDSNKVEKRISSIPTSNNGRSCGAVFARWLVALQDGDGKGREIELVVGEEEEEDYKEEEIKGNGKGLRRRVFDGIEFKEEDIMGSFNNHVQVGENNNNAGDEGEEAGRVSICIPPKNALLLMRCRSDPVKMAALANRFWDPTLKDDQDEDEDEDEDEEETHEDVNDEEKCEDQESEICGEKCDSPSCNDIGQKGADEEEEPVVEEEEQPKMVSGEEDVEQVVEEDVVEVEEQEENAKRAGTEDDFEVIVLEQRQDGAEDKENNGDVREEEEEEEQEEEEEKGAKNLVDLEEKVEEEVNELHSCEEHQEIEDKEIEKEEQEEERNEKPISSLASEQVEKHEEEEKVAEELTKEEEKEEEQTSREDPKEEREVEMGPPGLPDCLLLMMCEPKLSMEVSKEAWVCSTDFIRWLPERRHANTKKGGAEEPKKRAITVTALDGGNGRGEGPMSNPVPPAQLMQPPRSSCSFPLTASVKAAAPQSMASVVERKLVGTKPPYEPFVLTRCKSEPMRSAAKLTPDACFWKNRKIEPHRPATLGVGSAGVGF